MRKLRLVPATLLASALAASPASADVGVGLTVGEPTGLSVQFDVEQADSAVNLAVGADIDQHTHVSADYIWMAGGPIYVGLGGFVKDHPQDMGPHAGARVPVGVELELAEAPLEVFGELAPQVVVVDSDPDMPHRSLYLTGALGVRARF